MHCVMNYVSNINIKDDTKKRIKSLISIMVLVIDGLT